MMTTGLRAQARHVYHLCSNRVHIVLVLICCAYFITQTFQVEKAFKRGAITTEMIKECREMIDLASASSATLPANKPGSKNSSLVSGNSSTLPSKQAVGTKPTNQSKVPATNKTPAETKPYTLTPDKAKQCNTIQQERLQTMRKACSKIRSHNATDRELIRYASSSLSIVLEKEKALYCFVPKVACSSWKIKILTERGVLSQSSYNGKDTFHHDSAMQSVLAKYKIKTLKQYPPQQALRILKKYYKYIFVRDPYERLISGYRDKMLDLNNKSYRPMAKDIIARGANKTRKFPEFYEFLDYITERGGYAGDIHWARFTNLCNPCLVGYDFLGKVGSLAQDVECVLPKLHMSPWFPLPKDARSSGDKVTKYFSKVPKRIRGKISKLLANDNAVFGYKNLTQRGITEI